MSFVIKKAEPFRINVEDESGEMKEYKIPAYTKLGVDQLAIMDFSEDTPSAEKVNKIEEFFTGVCPELGDLGIGAVEWVELYKAYSNNQGE